MPEKSIREMNKLQRAHYSLQAKTFRSTIIGAIVFGTVALLIGIGLYAFALGGQYIGTAFNLSRTAKGFLEMKQYMDIEAYSKQVMDVYKSLTEEQKQLCANEETYDEYRAFFAGLEESPDYIQARSALMYFRESSDVYDIYVAVYDFDDNRLIYLVDPEEDEDYICLPGDWEAAKPKEFKQMMAWKKGDKRAYQIENTAKYGWLATSGVPLNTESGEAFALILSDVSIVEIGKGTGNFLLQFTIGMFITVNVVAFFMTRHMKKNMVQPINSIAVAAEKYTEDRKQGIKDTGYFENLNISTGDEIENLALIMADMEKDLAEYEDNLKQAIAEKERVGFELSLATRIQADMLPNIFPAFPERTDFDIYASMNPAKEVGGDFYDFFLIDDDHLALVIADVSGKGVPAALFMMVSKILVNNYVMTGISPKEVLQQVNCQICAHNKEEMFVTVWLGILDLKNGKLVASNAGHEYPIYMKAGGDFEIVKDRHGFVIGGMDCVRYTDYEIDMKPGSKLFVYTDGVPEATNADKELFGVDRMMEAINSAKESDPKTIIEHVDEAVNVFVGDAPQFDDVTMLCVHYIGRESDIMNGNPKVLTVEATVENIETVTEFVNRELEALDCPMKAQMQIDIAIDELFGNIAHYAYDPETGPATVIVDVEDDPMAVIITFMDNGKPFDPLAKADPDVTLSAEDREIGGLGVFLVKKTMDDISYEYKDGKNILRIKKNI